MFSWYKSNLRKKTAFYKLTAIDFFEFLPVMEGFENMFNQYTELHKIEACKFATNHFMVLPAPSYNLKPSVLNCINHGNNMILYNRWNYARAVFELFQIEVDNLIYTKIYKYIAERKWRRLCLFIAMTKQKKRNDMTKYIHQIGGYIYGLIINYREEHRKEFNFHQFGLVLQSLFYCGRGYQRI